MKTSSGEKLATGETESDSIRTHASVDTSHLPEFDSFGRNKMSDGKSTLASDTQIRTTKGNDTSIMQTPNNLGGWDREGKPKCTSSSSDESRNLQKTLTLSGKLYLEGASDDVLSIVGPSP